MITMASSRTMCYSILLPIKINSFCGKKNWQLELFLWNRGSTSIWSPMRTKRASESAGTVNQLPSLSIWRPSTSCRKQCILIHPHEVSGQEHDQMPDSESNSWISLAAFLDLRIDLGSNSLLDSMTLPWPLRQSQSMLLSSECIQLKHLCIVVEFSNKIREIENNGDKCIWFIHSV